jgi:hypothetical protein
MPVDGIDRPVSAWVELWMPDSRRRNDPLDIIILTCRRAESDFRYDLARELHALGHKVIYIFLKRQPAVTDFSTGATERWSIGRLLRFFGALRARSNRTIVFNSTNLAFVGSSVLLRWLSGTVWCLDMHDDLLYDTKGFARLKKSLSQKILTMQSDVIVHAAPELQRLFPTSRHIGNGSSLQPLPKTREDPAFVLVSASLDMRFDFAFMATAARACPNRHFEIYGYISNDDVAVSASLRQLLEAAPNISYHGPYTDPELPALFSRYLVNFAPYRTGIRLTEYIDPLRFYHCLASRTGLVSTAIPQAMVMRERIEVIDAPDQLDAALDRAIVHRNDGPARTWQDVAKRLEVILDESI